MESPKPQTVFRLPFSDAHLTYTVSDMGVEASGWPEPLLIGGDGTAWVLDRGPEGRGLRVVALSAPGRVVTDEDLLAAAGVKGSSLRPIAMAADEKGRPMIAAAREGDDKGAIVLTLGPAGKVLSAIPLPQLDYARKAVLTGSGELFDLEKGREGATWSAYERAEVHKAIASSDPSNEVANVGAAAVEWISHSRFRRLTPAAALPLRSAFAQPQEGELVGGEGPIFGIVATRAEDAAPGAKALTYRRTLTILLLDQDGSVESLGSVELSPTRFSLTNPREFTYYRAHQSRFAKDGTYLEIAWTASSLALERTALPVPPKAR